MADPRLPSMQALRAFDAAARLRSLTRAAESLYLTHGAISHQIKQLEEELGVRLIARSGRGITLTDEGERFATRIREALSEIGGAIRELRERSNPRQLRVSVMPSFAARWLLPRVGRFLSAHPEIDLDIRASTALADFRREDVDAAVRYGSGTYPGLTTEFLMGDAFFAVCSPKLLGRRRTLTLADLKRYTLLRSESEFWQPWFEAADSTGPSPPVDRSSTMPRTCCRPRSKVRVSRSRARRSSATISRTACWCACSTSPCPPCTAISWCIRRGLPTRVSSSHFANGWETSFAVAAMTSRHPARPRNAACGPSRVREPRCVAQGRSSPRCASPAAVFAWHTFGGVAVARVIGAQRMRE